jgi:hypothetical protein
MKCIDRYEEYKETQFDIIILNIRKGNIKAGRYAHLVKVNKNKIIKDKELFTNGKEESAE